MMHILDWIVALKGRTFSAGGAEHNLGELRFPTSGSPAVREQFETGVKLLHNFEYDAAQAMFQACQRIDPQFAMAFWGEAMCHNRPLWGEQDRDSARRVLQRLSNPPPRSLTDRERGFLESLKTLFGDGDKLSRDQGYAAALEDLAREHPDDHEIACFRALAMLGACRGRDERVYMQAASILEEVYCQNPRHPGALHYLIHCYDDPVHAPLGLRAARTYAGVAGNSAHAKHMPSHIFLALGMWDDVVRANQDAWKAGQARITRHGLGPGDYDIHAFHALQWLHYGRLQQGRSKEARQSLADVATIHRLKPSPMSKWYLTLMRAAHAVNVPDEKPLAFDVSLDGIEPSARASELYVHVLRSLSADQHGKSATEHLSEIRQLRTHAEQHAKSGSQHGSSYFSTVHPASITTLRVVEYQVDALLRLARGEREQAISQLREAVAIESHTPAAYGPPLPVKPSHELLAEVLLNSGCSKEACQLFLQTLERAPRRVASLSGLEEAARRAGADDVASRARRELTEILGNNVHPRLWQRLMPRQ